MTSSSVRRFVLDRLYPSALNGLPGLGTPQDLAAAIRAEEGSLDDQADRLIRRHLAISSAAGFASGLGGWLTLPITLPANIAGVALVQLHMVASIAALAGHDPTVPAVRERVIACLIGTVPEDPERDADQEAIDRLGLKLAEKGLKLVLSGAIDAAKWGAKKAVTRQVRRKVLRGIPLIGGMIGAVSDGYVTLQVAKAARDAFIGGLPKRSAPDFPPSSGDGLPDDVPTLSPSEPSDA